MAEYRRQRELEHTRAAAGGGITVNNTTATDSPKKEEKNDPLENLKKLKAMFENDLISQEEFNSKKTEILKNL